MYKVSSLKGAMCRSPLEGNILPRKRQFYTFGKLKNESAGNYPLA